MPNPIPRRRDAAVSREAILLSARKVFAQSGYEAADLSEIAAGAGVTATLINRYFDSREQLFTEVLADCMVGPARVAPGTLSAHNLGRTLATALVSLTETGDLPLNGLLILLRSASSKRAAIIGRAELEKGPQATVAAALEGQHHEERAALIMALVSGFQVMRQTLEVSALVKADPQVLIDLLTPLFQQLVDGASTEALTP
ncbi:MULTISPECIES: TetR/AcrR family transcriptional regulator [unclassified Pseudomonas]|uniref:TetR/AcrR family transcriptional regulator n=1 Tax=unclassified Pseudomonas TaxID=196821 RepID=UPI0020063A37|nr:MULTISPECIES: TetR/AcrR family transcriptional regulator [unclassified Pseudomonas]WLH70676.1 TetR family transcriptional regulator [Pseudomonas sp. FP2309]